MTAVEFDTDEIVTFKPVFFGKRERVKRPLVIGRIEEVCDKRSRTICTWPDVKGTRWFRRPK